MDKEFRYGQMELGMKGNGSEIRHTEKVNSGMLMVMCLTVSGKMIKPMVMESTLM